MNTTGTSIPSHKNGQTDGGAPRQSDDGTQTDYAQLPSSAMRENSTTTTESMQQTEPLGTSHVAPSALGDITVEVETERHIMLKAPISSSVTNEDGVTTRDAATSPMTLPSFPPQQTTDTDKHDATPPSLGPFESKIPRLLRFDDSPPEATGLALDIYARGTIVMTSLFLGPALLSLAREAAMRSCVQSHTGVDDYGADDDQFEKWAQYCEEYGGDERIHGMKPSSLLSNIATAGGLIGSALLPLVGAIVDHTSNRRALGMYTALGLVLIKSIEIFISLSTWFLVAWLQVFSAVIYMGHICATYAYTSELSGAPSAQTRYNAHYTVVLFVSLLLFLAEVVALSTAFGANDVTTGRIALGLSLLTGAFIWGYAWKYLFPERPALSKVPQGSSILACGFQKIGRTAAMVWDKFPALKWFMIALMFNEAGAGALITVATTFMNDFIGMDSSEIGVIFFMVLVAGIPGSKFGENIALTHDPVTSAKLCLVAFILSTASAAFVLTGPESKNFVAIFGLCWGFCLGWMQPMNTTIFITIIPKGQESELMGIYIFCGQVLSWLPPLLFTILNELGFTMTFGLTSLNFFFFVSLIHLFFMGNYERAVEMVHSNADDDRIDHDYHQEGKKEWEIEEGAEQPKKMKCAYTSPMILESSHRLPSFQ